MKERIGRRPQNAVLVRPGEGARLPTLGITHKVAAEASGGSLAIDEWGLAPGEMIPPHTHAREDECSFVLDGELTCYVGGDVVTAPRGSYVLKPRGVPHAFYNAGTETVRVVQILAPGASFSGYFDEYEGIAASPDPRRRARPRADGRPRLSGTQRASLPHRLRPRALLRRRAREQDAFPGRPGRYLNSLLGGLAPRLRDLRGAFAIGVLRLVGEVRA